MTVTTGGANPASLGKIAAGQAFFVQTSVGGGNITFTNTMRPIGNNSQFYRSSKKTALEKSRVWLNLSNENGVFKQQLIGYVEGATNELDNLYDAESFDGNAYADFYSINSYKNMVIQGRATPFTTTDSVPLGYKTTDATPMEITIDSADGVLENQPVYLEDKKQNTTHDLRQSSYRFVPIIGEEKDRFVLKFANENALNNESFENDKNNVLVYAQDKIIHIDAQSRNLNKVQVYDLLGRLIYDQNTNQSKITIENLKLNNQV
jgi:hypothetical protein